MFWTLKNPREKITCASISGFIQDGQLRCTLCVKWFNGIEANDGYAFTSLSSAKQYFGREYQSKKYGFEKPIWEEET